MSASARRKGHQFERDIVNKLKDELGVDLLYPDYKAGLRALLAAELSV